jgi:DNA (cytosine-5)-methyltransferase 1
MIYGSVCSGIEAATAGWHHLGWSPSFFSEIEPFPRAVLTHHYPTTPLHGDFTTITAGQYQPIDLLVGGTPCQAFSVAGLRKGLDDPRGNLTLAFLGLIDRLRPKWVVWENVPGVLSIDGGKTFGTFLGGLGEMGYGFAYRVLDAQWFGVAQRRRRVFVVGYAGDWRPPAAVLFERDSLHGHPAPRRKKAERVASSISTGHPFSGTRNERVECDAFVYPSTARMVAFGEYEMDGTASAIKARDYKDATDLVFSNDPAATICANEAKTYTNEGSVFSLRNVIGNHTSVRRLTPVECERLQGFPDNFTRIPWRNKPAAECPDGPRYKALGNSMAVPVMRWIGQRIQQFEELHS